jgi:hypothetical protein
MTMINKKLGFVASAISSIGQWSNPDHFHNKWLVTYAKKIVIWHISFYYWVKINKIIGYFTLVLELLVGSVANFLQYTYFYLKTDI